MKRFLDSTMVSLCLLGVMSAVALAETDPLLQLKGPAGSVPKPKFTTTLTGSGYLSPAAREILAQASYSESP